MRVYSYLSINLDASNRRRESKFRSITIIIRIGVCLYCVQIGGSENALIIIKMIQNKFANALCIWVIIVNTIPNANVTIRSSCDHMPAKTTNKSFDAISNKHIPLTSHFPYNNNAIDHLYAHIVNTIFYMAYLKE